MHSQSRKSDFSRQLFKFYLFFSFQMPLEADQFWACWGIVSMTWQQMTEEHLQLENSEIGIGWGLSWHVHVLLADEELLDFAGTHGSSFQHGSLSSQVFIPVLPLCTSLLKTRYETRSRPPDSCLCCSSCFNSYTVLDRQRSINKITHLIYSNLLLSLILARYFWHSYDLLASQDAFTTWPVN